MRSCKVFSSVLPWRKTLFSMEWLCVLIAGLEGLLLGLGSSLLAGFRSFFGLTLRGFGVVGLSDARTRDLVRLPVQLLALFVAVDNRLAAATLHRLGS